MAGKKSDHRIWLNQKFISKPNSLTLLIWISLLFVFSVSLLNFIGWIFEITFFKSMGAGFEPMRPVTAFCFAILCIGFTIDLLKIEVPFFRVLSTILASVVCFFAITTSISYLYVFPNLPLLGSFISPEQRMALLTAFNFLMLGIILLLFHWKTETTADVGHVLLIPVFLICYFTIISYILGVNNATALGNQAVAFNTGIAFFVLGFALLLLRPESWFMRLYTSQDTGGMISRILIFPVLALPVITGMLGIIGENRGMFNSETGTVIDTVIYTFCLILLISLTAVFLRKIERKKINSEEALKQSELKLKYHLENSPLGVIEWDKEFNVLQWSEEAEKMFGHRKHDVLGKNISTLRLVYEDDKPKTEKIMERLSSGREIKVISQNRNYNKNGEVVECVWYNSVLFDEKGKISSVMSLVENVTLLKRYQKELIASNEKYEELLANARSIIVKQDTSGKLSYINEFGLQFFGFNEEELIGKMATDTITPRFESTGRDLKEMIGNIYRDPDKFSTNINENIKKSGERVWIEWHNKALFNSNNDRTGHIGIGVDITIRKRAEEALIESEHKLWSVLNATQESIYMFDTDGIILMSNATGLRRIKKTAGQFIGHHFSEFLPPGVAKLRQLKFDEVIKTGKQVKFEDEREGKIYAHNFFPVFKNDIVASVVAYSRDITIRKKAESNLRESEDRFRTIAESLPVLIAITAVSDLAFLFINESAEKSFGYKKNTLAIQKLSDLFYSRDELIELGKILSEKGRIFNKEIRVKKADGTTFWIMISIRRISYINVPAYLTAATDITETKKNQEELLRLNRTLNAQSRSSQAMMHSRNEFNYLNQVCKIITIDCGHELVWIGYAMNDTRKSVKPMAFNGFDNGYINQMNITWGDDERGNGPTGNAIKTGKPALCRNMANDMCFEPWKEAALTRGYLSSLVLPLNQDGKTFGAISIYSKTTDNFSPSEIALLTGLADDLAYGISYIRLAEAEKAAVRAIKENEVKLKELVVTKDKFFNIVAHDLKNPFTSLLGSSELLYDNINNMTSDNVRKLALILNDSAKGGYAILQNLLDWSRSQTGLIKFNPEKLILKSIIDENLDNYQLQVMKKEINLKAEINVDICVWADKNMINTVLRNLLSNAVKYTFKNGTIEVKAFQGPRETTISVRDSGIGMSAEKVKTLFKIDNSLSLPGTEKEQGTGLGLKLCKEFTERMGGGIWVESEAGKGSEFKFTIPVVKEYDITI